MVSLEEQLQAILERNLRVEADKAWEVSFTRRFSIAVLTYAIAVIFLWSIESASPLLHGLIPTGGYVLSTFSLPALKRAWMRKHRTRK
ncbi:MAG: hypothetical protein Q7R81_04230 [Candidatus Peregrinibacteria bacterium]|nr:hypothetical protein [Candidatus Peregrinibacteria bacterium]